MKIKKLKDLLPDPYTNTRGLFQTLSIVPPEYDPRNLDILLYNRYGERIASNLIKRYDEIGECELALIASVIEDRYRTSWEKLNKALTIDYEPLENYNGIEEVTQTGTVGVAESSSASASGESNSENKTESDETTSSKMYGFNSSSAVDADKSSHSYDNSTSTSTENSTTGSASSTTTNDLLTVTKRHGNLGVTSSQQMIQQEIQLRKTQIIDTFVQNVGEMLTLKIYL